MTATKNNPTENTSDREIVISRVFDAPRELVWEAWSKPEHIVNWWGPRGFTTTIHERDFRPGGTWRHTMHGPDGTDYPNFSTFIEIVKPERIVYDHSGSKEGGPKVQKRFTWTFDDEGGGKTKITIHMVFPTAEERDTVVKVYGAIEGGNQTLARLGEHLQTIAVTPFVISREFNAPRDLVWKAWTERDRLIQWFGPKGFTMGTANLDFRTGGSFHYSLRSPDGKEMWGKFIYREIVEPERIVLVNSFSDEKGGLTRHPFSPTWPMEMLTTTTFTDNQGKTTITIKWSPINPTDEELKTFNSMHGGMNQGWTGTFEQLDDYLAKNR